MVIVLSINNDSGTTLIGIAYSEFCTIRLTFPCLLFSKLESNVIDAAPPYTICTSKVAVTPLLFPVAVIVQVRGVKYYALIMLIHSFRLLYLRSDARSCRPPRRRRTPGPSRCPPPAPSAAHRRSAATGSTHTPSPSTSSRWSSAPPTPGGSRTGTPRRSAAPASAPARPARRGRSRDAWANRRDRSHRSSTAGSCSGACSAWTSPGPSESICCAILTMSSVVTPMIWVSPRSNSALPCARGMTATSADSARMSVMPRPSMRKWSVRMRWRTSFLVSERYAAPISFSRPAYVSAEPLEHLGLDLVGAIVALFLAGDRQRLGQLVGGHRGHRVEHVVLVVREHRVVGDRLGGRVGQLLLRVAQRGDERLGGLQALGHDGLGGRPRAAGDELDDVVGGLGLDHHDGDVVSPPCGPRRPCRTRRPRAARRSGTRPTGRR